MSKQSEHLAPLTSLRFVAALFIYIHHIWGKFDLPLISTHGLFFGVGVPFFFALSGFILSYNYSKPKNLTDYIRMISYRLARIWPLHVSCLIIFIVLLRDTNNPLHSYDLLWANVSLIHSWLGIFTYSFSFNAVSWSLSNELFFYLLFPFIVGISAKYLITIALAASVVAMTWATATWSVGIRMADVAVSGQAIAVTHPLASLPIFISGILTARIFRRYRGQFQNRILANILEVSSLTLFALYLVYNREIGGFVSTLVGANQPVSRWILPMLGIAAFIPSIFVFAVGEGLSSKFLSLKPLVFLGQISFSFYLVHQPIVIWLNKTTSLGPIEGVGISLGLSILVSTILFKGVELPAQKELRGLADRALKPDRVFAR